MEILHIVENLDKGAVENWLVNTFIKSLEYRENWQWTFYCILGKPGKLDEIVRNHGGTILYSPVTISDKFTFLKHLRNALQTKKYDIIHSHHDFLSGFYLIAAIGIAFKKRILHVHNNDMALPVANRRVELTLLPIFKWLGLQLSDVVIGISRFTLENHLKGAILHKKVKELVLYYGVDFDKFEHEINSSIYKELNLSPESKLILFIGRLNEHKNPIFVLRILNELVKLNSYLIGVFIGKGDLEKELKLKTNEWGLDQNVRILGWREDAHEIMKQAHLFIFPRLTEPKEGLGLVVIESQGAGLPIMISPGIVDDAILIPELVTRVNYANNLNEWVRLASNILSKPISVGSAEALTRVRKSHFELSTATQNLISIYES